MQTKLDELLIMTRENNQMLRGLRRLQRLTFFFRILYWVILVGVAVGAFYFLQPYVAQIKSFGSSLPQTADIELFIDQLSGKE